MINVAVMTHNEPEAMKLLESIHVGKTYGVGSVWVLDDMSDPDFHEPLFALTVSRGFWFRQRRLDADFSAQRNFILDLMPADEWTLMLDADELVEPHFFRLSESQIEYNQAHDCDCLLVKRKNEHVEDNGEVETVVEWLPRLFLNRPNIRFERPVHEQLVGFKNQGRLPDSPYILHRKTRQRMHAQHAFYAEHFYNKGVR